MSTETEDKLKELLTAKQLDILLNQRHYTLTGFACVALFFSVLILGSWIVWAQYFKPVERAGQVVEATPAKEVSNLPTIAAPVTGGAVQAYPDAVKPKLNLPSSVVSNPKKKVVSSSKVQASDNPHTVTTLIDTDTGKAETYVRTDPLPWIGYTTRGSAGVYYGMKSGEQAVRMQVTQNIVQVKAVHIGATASIDRTLSTGKTDTFIGVGAEYRW